MNKLSKGSNLLWESSRIILPEHREAIIEHRKKQKQHPRPELAPQQHEEIERIIHYSYQKKQKIELTLYGLYENRKIEGTVKKIDIPTRRIKIENEWIPFHEIIEANT